MRYKKIFLIFTILFSISEKSLAKIIVEEIDKKKTL